MPLLVRESVDTWKLKRSVTSTNWRPGLGNGECARDLTGLDIIGVMLATLWSRKEVEYLSSSMHLISTVHRHDL